MVHPVGQPDRDCGRTELHAEIDDGGCAERRLRTSIQWAKGELVGDLAVAGGGWIVLKSVGVHRVERDARIVGVGLERARSCPRARLTVGSRPLLR
jgi:hypothetical protein